MISSNKINYIAILLIALVLIGIVCAMILPENAENIKGTIVYNDTYEINITNDDYYTTYSEIGVSKITLAGNGAESKNRNVKISDGNVTILGGGVYVLSGSLSDGSVIVDSSDKAEVRLILNGVNITSTDFPAIYIKESAKTVISLVGDTDNVLSDSVRSNEENPDDSIPTAALYSKDDLTVNGSGNLIINGNYQDGIKANDILKIIEGNIKVTSVDDGINANDYIAVLKANITVTSGGDGIKCENESEEKGFIAFEGTNLTITTDGDGISTSSALFINDTTTSIVSGGGSGDVSFDMHQWGLRWGTENSEIQDNTVSTKAIKAGTDLVIGKGRFNLDSCDDALHSDGNLTIEGGKFDISCGDDAIHSEINLTLNPESVNITKCNEGLEGGYITINGGNIRIVSNDDGINAVGDGSNGGMWMMRGNDGEEKTSKEDIWLTVNGGHIYIETSGDGFDSNGSAVINGGHLEIYGPENSGNGSIDVGDGGYALIMNGGSLLAAGSSGMADHPTESSPMQSLTFYLDKTYDSGSEILITDKNGNEIISGTSNKSFNWICTSTETLKTGETYNLLIDGNKVFDITANGTFATVGERNTMGTRGFRGGMGRRNQ